MTYIGGSAFSGCSSLENITIPFVGVKAGVTSSNKYQYPFGYIFGTNSYTGGVATKQYYYGDSTYSTTSTTYYIPSSLKSVTVTGGNILFGAFYNCTGLTILTLGNSVTSIGNSAFYNCTGLTSVTIGNSVTSIGKGTFYGCSGLTSVTIGNGVKSIDKNAFTGCNNLQDIYITDIAAWCNISGLDNLMDYGSSNKKLYINNELVTSVTIPDGVTIVPSSAFRGCSSLTSVTIPDSVTSIGSYAFRNCSKLQNIYITDIAAWCNISGLDNLMDYGSSNKKLYINNELATSITIPNGVKTIPSYAFRGCTGLMSITIPESVTSIGNYAFRGCTGLMSITIPESVTSIGNYAFDGCSGLTSVTIPESVTSIGSSAFDGCSGLTSVTIPDSVTSIGNYAFHNCSSLTSVTIPDGVTIIPSSAFRGCSNLTSVTIGNNVTSIGIDAFRDCTGLTSITIPDSVTSIGDSAFSGCNNLQNIYITDIAAWCNISGLSNLMKYGASNKKLYINNELATSIILPNGVTTIPSNAFSGCTGLTSVTIPDSVKSIDESAFSSCSSLESITIPFVGAKAGVTSSDTYQYPLGYIFGTSSYTGGIATTQYYYGNSTSSTTSTTYYIPSSLKSVTVTGGNILYGAFYNCTGLTSVTIGNSVTSIGNSAFEYCTGLTSVTIPDSVKSIDESAFSSCSSLESITIPFVGAKAGVTSSDTYQYPLGYIFGTSSYTGGIATTQYYYGNSTSSTTSTTYYIPSSLKSVTVTGGNILYGAFYDCTGLTSITIPDSVTSIGERAFYDCTGLTSVTIPNSVTSIGESAFGGCYRLVEVYNKSSLKITAGSSSNGYVAYYAKNVYTNEGGSKLTTDENGYVIYTDGDEKILVAYHGTNTELILPSDITKINQKAFRGCTELTSITIPDSVTSIGENAFSGCSGLTSITIPNSVTSIGSSAFSGCDKLQDIYITDIAAWCNISGLYYLMEYGASNKKLYINNELVTSITIQDGVTAIPFSAFRGCTGLTSITISDSVTSIGASAFSGCTGLTSITIPNSVTSIGDGAFSGCNNLQNIYITDIAAWCNISGLSNLMKYGASNKNLYLNNELATSITIPNGVTAIPSSAFRGCSRLTSITIPNSVTSIGASAFRGCTGLTSITIPDSVKSIGSAAFSGCSSLESITIPFVGAKAGVTSSDTYQYPFGYIFGTSSYTGGVATPQYYYVDSTFGTTNTTYYIPSSLKSVTVTGGNIFSRAFYNCTGLTSITIPDSVTSIDYEAFYHCTGLTSITIPDSVKSIGKYAFEGCTGLTSITIPNSVTSIGSSAFRGCSGLTSVTIPDSVKSIDYGTFEYCTGLMSITIPNSVKSIGDGAFRDCYKLIEVYNKSSLKITAGSSSNGYVAYYARNVYTSEGGSKLTEDENGYVVYTDGNIKILVAYLGTNTELILPSYITGINQYAFYNCTELTSIIVVKGNSKYHSAGNCLIETATKTLILGCNTSVIPTDGSVTSIGERAFRNCTGLTSITIPNSVTSIGASAFSGCSSLENITIPFVGANAGVTSSDNFQYPFGYIFGTSSYIGGVATPQSYYVDSTSSATSTTYYIPSSLKSVTVTGGNILRGAFYNCSGLTSITIPNSVTSIGSSAFYNCTGLTNVTIPDSVKSIGYGAFSGCSSLESITIPFVGANAGVTSSDNFQYPFGYIFGTSSYTGGVATPQSSSTSSTTYDTYYIPSSLKTVTVTGGNILDGAFYNCSGLTSITIPDSVTSIGSNAFMYCSGLTSITIPDSVTSIGERAFFRCRGLTSVTIPGSVTSIGSSAFSDCSGLTSVTIPDSVKSIGYGTFEFCTGLTSITIGSGVTSIGDYAFSGCSGLTSITFNGTKAQWNAISKGNNWKRSVPATQVVCTDGTISIY